MVLLDTGECLVGGVLEVQSRSPVEAVVRLNVDLAAGGGLSVVVVCVRRNDVGTDEGVDVCSKLARIQYRIQALDDDGRLDPLLPEVVAMVVDGAPINGASVDGAGHGGQAGKNSGRGEFVGEHFESGA